MSSPHELMVAELQSTVVSKLRAQGFKGSYPHFRRFVGNRVDLLTFQHDKWGRGFVLEIARATAEGVTRHWGEVISANKITAHDLHPSERKRIKPREGPGQIHGFDTIRDNLEHAPRRYLSYCHTLKRGGLRLHPGRTEELTSTHWSGLPNYQGI